MNRVRTDPGKTGVHTACIQKPCTSTCLHIFLKSLDFAIAMWTTDSISKIYNSKFYAFFDVLVCCASMQVYIVSDVFISRVDKYSILICYILKLSNNCFGDTLLTPSSIKANRMAILVSCHVAIIQHVYIIAQFIQILSIILSDSTRRLLVDPSGHFTSLSFISQLY